MLPLIRMINDDGLLDLMINFAHDTRETIVTLKAEHDPEEELAVLDQLIEWQRQTGEYGDAAK